ncbi:YtfJ family protein [Mesoterricola sediminis]|uniref:Transcriptional regulator n=1 Tax=Mesoterricola sediminis TaxID=2927980 RepID=A0AA48KEJ5_9BACT|nr:YtfJ family protein [Mesoterricola sediminis]BDU75518.1 transcriptional regulator [Mesoterricola sediminis]
MKAVPALLALCLALPAPGVEVGRRLPEARVAARGLLVPRTRVEGGRMVLDGKEIAYRPWSSAEGSGRVRTFYHLAARMGVDDINKAYIDALIAAKLPELLPDGAYKTVTILDLSQANFVTRGIGAGRLEKSQRETPYALFVADASGAARAAWGLKPGESAVIVLDRDDTVLFFKEGRLTADEIARAVGLIQARLRP